MSDDDSTPPAGFRKISGFPRYAIDENGTVLSVCRDGPAADFPWSQAHQVKPLMRCKGYYYVMLYNAGISRHFSIHTLVLTTFVGPCPDGMQCRHLDGNKTNNHISNLAWGTAVDNRRDMRLHGRLPQGEMHRIAKLTTSDVLEIRRRRASGERLRTLVAAFPVTKSTIQRIVKRTTWKHI